MNGYASPRETLDAHEWKLVMKWAGLFAFWILLMIALGGCAGTFRTDAARFARVSRSTVIVTDGTGLGTGTVVGVEPGRALVLTAFHVVDGSQKLDVAGERFSCPAVIERAAPEEDLVLLRVLCDLGQPPLSIASAEPARFSRVFLLGASNAYVDTPSVGTLARTDQEVPGMKSPTYLVSLALFEGDSGGPLVDEKGAIVAVASRMPTFAAPVYIAKSVNEADDDEAPHTRVPMVARVPVPSVGVFVGLPAIRRLLGLSS